MPPPYASYQASSGDLLSDLLGGASSAPSVSAPPPSGSSGKKAGIILREEQQCAELVSNRVAFSFFASASQNGGLDAIMSMLSSPSSVGSGPSTSMMGGMSGMGGMNGMGGMGGMGGFSNSQQVSQNKPLAFEDSLQIPICLFLTRFHFLVSFFFEEGLICCLSGRWLDSDLQA